LYDFNPRICKKPYKQQAFRACIATAGKSQQVINAHAIEKQFEGSVLIACKTFHIPRKVYKKS
jgi:hypothetical protein